MSKLPARAILLLFCVAPWFGVAAQAPAAPDAMVQRALELRLHESRFWHKLLHYAPTRFADGRASRADSAGFFLHPQGSTDPRGELSASVQALFEVADGGGDASLRCRLPARYLWLRQALAVETEFDPLRDCAEFAAWYEEINPARAVLVFPAAYLNNPSSMYGHTLLRLDPPAVPSGSTLYSYAINFAAVTAETNGFMFAFKGLFGLYPGAYSVLPYFRKVSEYSDLENRDMWEYPLDLDPLEIRFMLAHLWELREVRFDYYFFDENCSYQLLALLEVARDSLDLTSAFTTHAIPSDTLHAALAQLGPGVSSAVYRPSLVSRIRRRQSLLQDSEIDLVEALADADIAPDAAPLLALPASRQALILETAYDYMQYRHYRDGRSAAQTSPTALGLLRQRSRIDAAAPAAETQAPPSAPHLGHPSARLDIGAGRGRGDDYLRLAIKPAYHDLLDAQAGFLPGAQINMFGVDLRASAGSAYLDTLELVDIVSLAPRERLFGLGSWRINAAFRRLPLGARRAPLGLSLDGGYGVSIGTPELMHFALLEAGVDLHRDFERSHLPSLGLRFGTLYHPHQRWALQATLSARHYYADLDRDDWRVALEQRFGIDATQALRLDLAVDAQGGDVENLVQFNWQYYF